MSERRLSKRSSAIEKRKVLEDKLEKRRIAKERRSRSDTLPVQQQEEAASADSSNENLLVDPVHSSRESLEWDSSVGELPSFVVAPSKESSPIEQVETEENLVSRRKSSTDPNILKGESEWPCRHPSEEPEEEVVFLRFKPSKCI